MEKKKILYIRSGPYQLNFSNYNLQEVGLGKAFCRKGYDFDIVYYSKEDRDQVVGDFGGRLRILWRKGFKLLRTGLYPKLLNKEFLAGYDAVITSEYSQLMSVLVSRRHENTYLYNGPYYNLFKLPFVEPIYDRLYCKKLNGRMKKVFCKTNMAARYIANKGITNTEVVGVGLDAEKFEAEHEIKADTQALLDKMAGKRNILYVGAISERKNTALLLQAFAKLKNAPENADVQLVLVGKGSDGYVQKCKSLPQEGVIWCNFIENAQLKFVYETADIFTLPSSEEIFGMVLLEALYFGTATVASHTAGAETLISQGQTGIILEDFDPDTWAKALDSLLGDPDRIATLGENAAKSIREHFMWDGIAEKMLRHMA